MKKRQVRQTVFPLLAAFIWGTAFVAQSVSTDYVEPFTFNAARAVIASIVLYLLVLLQQKGTFFKTEEEQKNSPVKIFKNKELLVGGVLCGIALFVATNLQQFGLGETAPGKAGFITALYIVLVPIFQVFLGKKVPAKIWISITIAVVGLYFLCIKQGFSIEKGDFLVFLCAIVFAIHILIIDRFTQRVNGIQLSFIQFTVVSILSVICMIIFEQPNWAGLLKCAFPILYVGIFSSGVAYTLQILAQKDSNPTVVSLLLSLEAVFATVAGFVVLGDVMSIRELVGCGFMLVAVVLSEI